MKNLEVQETEPGRPEGVRQRCYPRRWVASIFKSLRACSHDWSISWTNGFGHPSEKICILCGEYRHKIYDVKMMGDEEWKTGRHPQSK